MKIILIAGKARHGKDTLGDYLQKEYENLGKKVCRIQFGAYIKYYAKTYFGWDGSEETKPRELLQTLGTDIIRNKIDKKFHVNRTIEDILVLDNFFDIAIISDVREPIEITSVKEKFTDVISVKINRPNFTSPLTGKQQQHYTEVAMDNFNEFDYFIENDKSLEDLEEKAKELVSKEE